MCRNARAKAAALTALLLLATAPPPAAAQQQAGALTALSRERLVFQTAYGDLHLAFYPNAAPKTVDHIRRCGELGLYTTNHFFRVDRGFVAQTADVPSGRTAPMSAEQRQVAERKVPLEVLPDIKHNKRGILSMARHDDPNSGGSSFSILLGPAPHLDMQYTVFGEVVAGIETLAKLEELPTKREGIFVMPLDRITILATYTYVADGPEATPQLCTEALAGLQARYDAQAVQLEAVRQERLPGRR